VLTATFLRKLLLWRHLLPRLLVLSFVLLLLQLPRILVPVPLLRYRLMRLWSTLAVIFTLQ